MILDQVGKLGVSPPFRSPRAFYALRCLPLIPYGLPEGERPDVALGPDSHRDGTLATNQVEL